mgnify:CR=1 FL=1
MMPETKVVQPRRKKSQWKPAGRLTGKPRLWAMTELTLFCEDNTGWVSRLRIVGRRVDTHVEVEEQGHEATERQRDKDPLDRQRPERDDPIAAVVQEEGQLGFCARAQVTHLSVGLKVEVMGRNWMSADWM